MAGIDIILEKLRPKNIWSQRQTDRLTDRPICQTEMKVKESKKEQRKQGCCEEGGGSKTKREKEASKSRRRERGRGGGYIFSL